MFQVINYLADNGGCSFYRLRFPSLAAQTFRKDVRCIESFKIIPYPDFYRDFRVVRFQRQVSDIQTKFFLEFAVPLSRSIGFWVVYEIDDVVHKDDIPPYNIGRSPYQNEQYMKNISLMMNSSDIVTVTTDALKNYYIDRFDVSEDRFLVIPNYLPRWWIGEVFHEDRISNRFDDNRRKPRIGFASSSTHFDLKNQNDGVDDFTHIVDFVKSTVDKYQWVLVGGYPQQLIEEIKERKVEYHPGSDLLNYPRELDMRSLDLVVAPLKDNIFNRCKSNIKWQEMSALGIPCICQDLLPYQGYTDLLFRDSNDLQNQIDELLKYKEKYMEVVKHHRHIIDYGDSNSPSGWWLEKNFGSYLRNIFCLPQKTINFDLSQEQKTNENDDEIQEIVFDNKI